MTLKNSLSEQNNANGGAGRSAMANSGLSLWQLTLKSIKRHIWLPILALLGFVLALPVASTLAISNFGNWDFNGDKERQLEYFMNWAADLTVMWQMLSACIIVVGALLSILVMFRYLHVRAQVDFYHSLPVRREQLFAGNVLAAFLVFLAPYLLATLLNVLVLAVTGWVEYVNMGLYLQFILFNILVYVLFLGCGCLAMQLSGTMPSALKILVMIFGLAPLLAGMYEMLGSLFFDTWVSMFSSASVVLLKASVIERYFMLSAMARGGWWYYDADIAQVICWQDWLAAVLLAAAMLGASLLLYRRRSSEAAGSTLAFGWQKPLYKYPLVICSGLMLGVFFYLMGEGSILWLYFGAVLGTMFMALLLEVFIKSDFKAIKKGWRSAAVASVAVCLLLSVYAFDWVGFDQRQPDSDKVAMIYVDSANLAGITSDYYYDDYIGDDFFSSYWTLNRANWLQNSNMMPFSEPQNVEAVLALVANAQNTQKNFEYGVYDFDQPQVSERLEIYYRLKNGSMRARSYWIRNVIDEDYQQIYETLLGSDEWRENLPINRLDLEHTIMCSLDSYMLGSEGYLYLMDLPEGKINDEWRQQLLQTLRQDYAKATAEDFLYSSPVGNLDLGLYKERTYVPEGDYYDYSMMRRFDVKIFPCMTDTIALLNEMSNDMLTSRLAMSNVVELREYRKLTGEEQAEMEPGATTNAESAYPYDTEMKDMLVATYRPETDAAAIEQILQNTVTDSAYWHSSFWNDSMATTYYQLVYKQLPDEAEYEDGLAETITDITLFPKPSRELFEQLIQK